jgi:hypothetical protein
MVPLAVTAVFTVIVVPAMESTIAAVFAPDVYTTRADEEEIA